MRPRNVLTETNDMRKMMGLPLLNENGGHTIDDIKKEILNENSPAGFSLGMARQGGLTLTEDGEEDYKKYLNLIANNIGISGKGSKYKNGEGETINIYTFNFEDAKNLAGKGVISASDFSQLSKLYNSTQEISETTEAEDFRDEGVGKEPLDKEFDEPINEIEKAQKMAEERALKAKKNKFPMEDNVMQEQDPDFGDGEGGLGEPADDQVFAEQDANVNNNVLQCVNAAREKKKTNKNNGINGDTEILNGLIKCLSEIGGPLKESGSFSKYNVTEGWYDHKKSYGDDESNDSYSNDSIKKDVRRIISFLTPGEGDEIEGRYMDNIYPAMALQTAEILYGKL